MLPELECIHTFRIGVDQSIQPQRNQVFRPNPMAQEIALDRVAMAGRGRRLEYFTIAWNCLEGLVAVIPELLQAAYLLLASVSIALLRSRRGQRCSGV